LKLYRKLVLFILAAAVVPLTAVGFVVLRGAERALSARIAVEQATAARRAASSLGHELDRLFDQVRQLISSWDLQRLTDAELEGFLRLMLDLSPHIGAVALVDTSRAPVVPPIHGGQEAGAMEPAALPEFLQAIPIREAVSHGLPVLSSAFSAPDGRSLAALAYPVKGRGGQSWILGILVELASFREQVQLAIGSAGAASVLDAGGRVLLTAGLLGSPVARSDEIAIARLRVEGGTAGQYVGSQGMPILAAYAPVPGDAGWGVFIRLPAEEAFADVRRLRRTVLGASVATLAAFLLLAWVFVRGVTRGLARIDLAAREMGRGNLAVRVPVRGRDEVAQVSATLNQVGAELEAARGKLQRWNEELKAEVEARTRELKEAQAQLLEAQKLAAIGQLGAGVAHEINNPLSGVLGHAQLLLGSKRPEDPDYPILERVEQLAKRCRDITQNLLRFSQQRAAPDFQSIDLNQVVRDTLSLLEGQVRESGIELRVTLAEPLPAVKGDPGHLGQVLLNLVINARTACSGRPSPMISIATRVEEGHVSLEVKDTGKGIAAEVLPRIFEPFFTTKDVWSNVGLGLSVSYRIVSEHGGRIRVDSRLGEGSSFAVVLPSTPAVQPPDAVS
jgi:two-component system NtrC family sensor kinase